MYSNSTTATCAAEFCCSMIATVHAMRVLLTTQVVDIMVFRSKYGAQIIMTPTYIMPPKPTCKVVKREGQRGARIDPKGCKVRTTKDTQGNKRQYNKRGEEKITLKTTGNEMRLVVAGARQHSTVRNWGNRTMRQRAEWRDRHKMIYDTGAQVTSMSREMCDSRSTGRLGAGWPGVISGFAK